jgi:hypothetical protein
MEMRRVLIVLLGVLLALVIPGTAFAAAEPSGNDNLVVLSGNAFVPPGQVVDSVVVFNGSVRIEGTVMNTVVAFNGPVTVKGTVDGNVAVFNGTLFVRDGARVTGDVYADTRVIAPGATVTGTVSSMSRLGWTSGWATFAIGLAFWLAIVVSTLILGFMLLWFAPRAADAVEVAGRTAVGPSIGWGLGVMVGLPVLGVIAIATLVGIPLGFGILLALAMIFAIGQATGAWLLGRRIVKTGSRFGAFALGWAILSVAMPVPVIGSLALTCAVVYGLGTISVAAFRARRGPVTAKVAPPLPPAPISA